MRITHLDRPTGEIFEVEYSDLSELRSIMEQNDAKRRELAAQREAIQKALFSELGDDKEYRFKDGMALVQVHAQTTEYDPSSLRRHIDQDRLEGIATYPTGKVKALLRELVDEGALSAEATKDIKQSQTTAGKKPYIVLQRMLTIGEDNA